MGQPYLKITELNILIVIAIRRCMDESALYSSVNVPIQYRFINFVININFVFRSVDSYC